MKKFKRIAAISLLAVLFIGTFAYLYKKSRPQPERYEEITPELSDISRNTVVTGKIVTKSPSSPRSAASSPRSSRRQESRSRRETSSPR